MGILRLIHLPDTKLSAILIMLMVLCTRVCHSAPNVRHLSITLNHDVPTLILTSAEIGLNIGDLHKKPKSLEISANKKIEVPKNDKSTDHHANSHLKMELKRRQDTNDVTKTRSEVQATPTDSQTAATAPVIRNFNSFDFSNAPTTTESSINAPLTYNPRTLVSVPQLTTRKTSMVLESNPINIKLNHNLQIGENLEPEKSEHAQAHQQIFAVSGHVSTTKPFNINAAAQKNLTHNMFYVVDNAAGQLDLRSRSNYSTNLNQRAESHLEQKANNLSTNSESYSNTPTTVSASNIASKAPDGQVWKTQRPTVSSIAPTAKETKDNESSVSTQTSIEGRHFKHDFPVLSSTVFEITKKLKSSQKQDNEYSPIKMESQISDIQIEVYDSTVDSIVASTNFKDFEQYAAQQKSVLSTTKSSVSLESQDRFTQYVIDSVDDSTQRASVLAGEEGDGEPAAIEIHINVSEALSNGNDDSKMPYQQAVNINNEKYIHEAKPQSSEYHSAIAKQSGTSREANDETLLVDIINSSKTSSDNSASGEHISPKFTFRSDPDFNSGFQPAEALDISKSDYNFRDRNKSDKPKSTLRNSFDSDTIFYISNTEVKVAESLSTANKKTEQHSVQAKNLLDPGKYAFKPLKLMDHYEEELKLSPKHTASNRIKSLAATSIIEVDQAKNEISNKATVLPPEHPFYDDRKREGDVSGGAYENVTKQLDLHIIAINNGVSTDIKSNSNYSKVGDSSIQYGGDLIDDMITGDFDAAENAYPFGNLTPLRLQVDRQPQKSDNNAHSGDEEATVPLSDNFTIDGNSINYNIRPFNLLAVSIILVTAILPITILVVFLRRVMRLFLNGTNKFKGHNYVAEKYINKTMEEHYISKTPCPVQKTSVQIDDAVFIIEIVLCDEGTPLPKKSPAHIQKLKKDNETKKIDYSRDKINERSATTNTILDISCAQKSYSGDNTNMTQNGCAAISRSDSTLSVDNSNKLIPDSIRKLFTFDQNISYVDPFLATSRVNNSVFTESFQNRTFSKASVNGLQYNVYSSMLEEDNSQNTYNKTRSRSDKPLHSVQAETITTTYKSIFTKIKDITSKKKVVMDNANLSNPLTNEEINNIFEANPIDFLRSPTYGSSLP